MSTLATWFVNTLSQSTVGTEVNGLSSILGRHRAPDYQRVQRQRRPSGEAKIDASVILTGQDASQPKTWTHNGSFMAFRELQQLVPEFDDFVNQTSLAFQLTNPAITPDLIGARVVGRWKSGTQICCCVRATFD